MRGEGKVSQYNNEHRGKPKMKNFANGFHTEDFEGKTEAEQERLFTVASRTLQGALRRKLKELGDERKSNHFTRFAVILKAGIKEEEFFA